MGMTTTRRAMIMVVVMAMGTTTTRRAMIMIVMAMGTTNTRRAMIMAMDTKRMARRARARRARVRTTVGFTLSAWSGAQRWIPRSSVLLWRRSGAPRSRD